MIKRVGKKVLYERKEREKREKERMDRKMERQRGGSYRYNLDERQIIREKEKEIKKTLFFRL